MKLRYMRISMSDVLSAIGVICAVVLRTKKQMCFDDFLSIWSPFIKHKFTD